MSEQQKGPAVGPFVIRLRHSSLLGVLVPGTVKHSSFERLPYLVRLARRNYGGAVLKPGSPVASEWDQLLSNGTICI
jgi:hypothetical protein